MPKADLKRSVCQKRIIKSKARKLLHSTANGNGEIQVAGIFAFFVTASVIVQSIETKASQSSINLLYEFI